MIQGSKTQITAMDRLAVDPYNGEIFVPEGDKVLVFDRLANGNVAPKRVLGGPNTGFTAAVTVAIDHVRNLLVVGAEVPEGKGAGSQLAIFDRTASGNVKPKRVISGPKARIGDPGNMRVYPEGGLIFVVQQAGYVGVWSIDDNGEIPPRYTVGGPKGMLQKPRGLDLDPKHHAVIVSDKGLNAVLTLRCRRSSSLRPRPQAADSPPAVAARATAGPFRTGRSPSTDAAGFGPQTEAGRSADPSREARMTKFSRRRFLEASGTAVVASTTLSRLDLTTEAAGTESGTVRVPRTTIQLPFERAVPGARGRGPVDTRRTASRPSRAHGNEDRLRSG